MRNSCLSAPEQKQVCTQLCLTNCTMCVKAVAHGLTNQVET